MAKIVRRTGGWLWWMAGAFCALVFGRAPAGEPGNACPGERPPTPAAEPDPGKEKDPERPGPRLEDSEDWKVIVDAWKLTKPLADRGRSTRAERGEATDRLVDAGAAADRLVRAGLLAAAEAALLADEAAKVKAEIHSTPPSDARLQTTCYMVAGPDPVAVSYERLERRLPLLEQLVRRGKVSRGVANRVLATFESDLRTLSERDTQNQLVRRLIDDWVETWGKPGDEELAKVAENERAELAKKLTAARAALRKVRELASR